MYLKSHKMILTKENLDKYLKSKKFLNEPYIKSLADKTIEAGFNLECILDTFKKFFLDRFQGVNSIDLDTFDFNNLCHYEKFVEHVIYTANTKDSMSGGVGMNKNAWPPSGMNNDDFDADDQNDPSYFDDNEQYPDYMMSQQFNKMNLQNHQFQQQQQQQRNLQMQKMQQMGSGNLSNNKSIQIQLTGNKTLVNNKQLPKKQFEEFVNSSISNINDKSNLRPIIIDGNDVALSGSNQKNVFSLNRIKKVYEFFEKRGHQVYLVIPSWRKEQIQNNSVMIGSNSNNSTQTQTSSLQSNDSNEADQQFLNELEIKNSIICTPSKKMGSKRIVCNDDPYILQLAKKKEGIIVSNDNFKAFINNEEFKPVIEQRVLMYSFFDDTFLPAEDPLGKNGPNLDNFLRFKTLVKEEFLKPCPFKKKCTYGSKCKYFHPERLDTTGNQHYKTAHQSIIDDAREQKLKLEIILNKSEDATESISNSNNNSRQEIMSGTKLISTSSLSPTRIKENLAVMNKQSLNKQPLQGGAFTFNLMKTTQQEKKETLKTMGPESNGPMKISNFTKSIQQNMIATQQNDWSAGQNFNRNFYDDSSSSKLDAVNGNLGGFLTSNDDQGLAMKSPFVPTFIPASLLNPKSMITSATTNASSVNATLLTGQLNSCIINDSGKKLSEANSKSSSTSSLSNKIEEPEEILRDKLLKSYTEDQVEELLKKYSHIKDFETLDLLANGMFFDD